MDKVRVYNGQQDEDKVALLATLIWTARDTLSAYEAVEAAENIIQAIAERKAEEYEEANATPFGLDPRDTP